MGISSKALDETINPGFEKFARENRLERCLIVFDHKLQVASDGKLSIFYQGKFQPWEAVREIALAKPQDLIGSASEFYNPPIKYSSNGVVNESRYAWTELKPLKREENPSWGKRYILEICCLCTGHLRLFGDHTWVRLKTPEGDIYAPGIYREDNDIWTGFTLKKGKVQNPDVSEFWPEKIHTISFEISEEAFFKIKQKIESDHNEDRLHFQLVEENCTNYALDLAKIAGIDIPTKVNFVSNFIPEKLQKTTQALGNHLPRPIKGVVDKGFAINHYLYSVFFNIVDATLGGTKLSDSFSTEEKSVLKPHIASPWDILKTSKLDFRSPYVLAFILAKEIDEERKAEAVKRGVDVDTLRYFVPDKYRKKLEETSLAQAE